DGSASWDIADRPLLSTRAKASTQISESYRLAGRASVSSSTGSAPGYSRERLDRGFVRITEDFRPGVYDVHARIRDMDPDGIWASVLIPSITFGFAGQRFSLMKDTDAGLACVQAYNDWLAEEVAGAYPERLICSQIPWLGDPAIGAREVRRNADRGFTAV